MRRLWGIHDNHWIPGEYSRCCGEDCPDRYGRKWNVDEGNAYLHLNILHEESDRGGSHCKSVTTPPLYAKNIHQDLLSGKACNRVGIPIVLDADPDNGGHCRTISARRGQATAH
jgi:hypothetical protein